MGNFVFVNPPPFFLFAYMVDRHHMSSVQVAEWEDRIGVTHGMGGGGGQLKAFCQGCGIIAFLFC